MLRSRIPQITVEIELLVQDAMEDGAEEVALEARSRVPVATGSLRDAIHVDRERDGVYVVAGDDESWYGHLVEHGTTHTAPHPFLVPALEGNRDGIVRGVRDRLRAL